MSVRRSDQTPAIAVRGLHKHFGKIHVLRGLDLTIQPGEGVILLGANGCGKSTLMRCLNGLESPDQGRVTMQGTDVSRRTARSQLRDTRRRIGMVFQHFNLVDNISVFQNVLYGALGRPGGHLLNTLNPFASQALRTQAMACLERVNLADKANERCNHLSGGQQQRVAIARMLMQEPEVIVADEPVASLDPKAGQEVMALLWDIVRERKLTVFCTLHQLELAREYADRIVGMKAGQLAFDGSPSDLTGDAARELYRGHVRVDQPTAVSKNVNNTHEEAAA